MGRSPGDTRANLSSNEAGSATGTELRSGNYVLMYNPCIESGVGNQETNET